MLEKSKKAKIGLVRGVTDGNLGNAAFEAAAVQHLVDYFPGAELYVSCIDSLEPLRSCNVRLFPVNRDAEWHSRMPKQPVPTTPRLTEHTERRGRDWLRRVPFVRFLVHSLRGLSKVGEVAREIAFWARSFKFSKDLALLIVCGGGQLNDYWGGPWGNPFTLFMWTTLAKLSRTRVLVLNVGTEAVSSKLSRWFLMRVLRKASYRSFRDDDSRKAVEGWGPCGASHVFPDLAFSYKIPETLRNGPRTDKTGVIGINPMPIGDPRLWPVADMVLYQNYLRTLAAFTRALLERNYSIVLFVTQVRMDQAVLPELMELIVGGNPALAHRVSVSHARTVDELLALMPGFDFVAATRFHAILLAQLMGVPTLAISYENKINALMADLGLSEFCVDIAGLELPALMDRFSKLESNRPVVTEMLRHRVGEYRDELQRQYDALFGS